MLQNNGSNLAISANGSFTFSAAIASGNTYAVTVFTHPSSPTQTCTVSSGTGSVGAGNITNVSVSCTTNNYTIGGAVSGLAGAGLVLQNNGNNLALAVDGNFTFSTAVVSGGAYAITVLTQPSSPAQICTVSNGSSKVTTANITNVSVSCVNTYTIGGTVTGLTGAGLVLQNNGANNLAISANGNFTFSTAVISGMAYAVTLLTQPSLPEQTCIVSNGSDSAVTANVTTVSINCNTNTYTIGGTVSGLAGNGLVLQNNGANNLAISANGNFTFSTSVASGNTYAVTVFTQPTSPAQICTVSNNSGLVVVASITNVSVSCVNAYTIGGIVSGSLGTGLVLQNNGGNNLAISANGSFTFSTAFVSSSTYSVTVLTQPAGHTCVVTSGTGTVITANVTNVQVSCVPTAPALAYGIKTFKFSWSAVNGATYYRLFENPDGVSGYTQIGGDITATSYDHSVFLPKRLNASYVLAACKSAYCTGDSAEVGVSINLVEAIGYMKASNTEANDVFGHALAISADGGTLAVGAYTEDSNATGIGGDQTNNSATNSGAVYVFTRSGSAWSQQAYVKASNTEVNDLFGYSLALSADGDTLTVGAYYESSNATGIGGDQTNNSATNSGAVYVFTRSGSAWSQQAYVKASNTDVNDQFGYSLALSADGNTLAVGAPNEASNAAGIGGDQTNNSVSQSGAVYIFIRSSSTWSQQVYVKASTIDVRDIFGSALALSADGNTLAVGAQYEDSNTTGVGGTQTDNSATDSGAVYVFTRSGSTWTQQSYIKASNTDGSDQFGHALTLSADGNTMAVGADGESSNIGAVYVFARSGSAWSQQAYVKASNAHPTLSFGSSLAFSADGNILAVGAPGERSISTGIGGSQNDYGQYSMGAVYVFARVGSNWPQQAYIKASNTNASDLFGLALALSADGNTLAAGAPYEASNATDIGGTQMDNSARDSGAVYLY